MVAQPDTKTKAYAGGPAENPESDRRIADSEDNGVTQREEDQSPESSRRKDQVIGWGLVAVQGALIVGIILTPTSDAWPLSSAGAKLATALTWIGVALVVWAVLVFGRGVTPSPVPSSKATLQTRGPYRWIRHPMYTGVIVLMAGSALGRQNWIAAALWVLLIVFFLTKIRWEERRLVKTYPGYQSYRESVPALIPLPRRTPPTEPSNHV